MGIGVSNLQKDVRTFPLVYNGEEAKVTYRPSVVTPARLDALREVPAEEGDRALVMLLSELLVEWEVMDDDGSPFPTSAPALSTLPIQFLAEVVNQIRDDTNPAAAGKASPAG